MAIAVGPQGKVWAQRDKAGPGLERRLGEAVDHAVGEQVLQQAMAVQLREPFRPEPGPGRDPGGHLRSPGISSPRRGRKRVLYISSPIGLGHAQRVGARGHAERAFRGDMHGVRRELLERQRRHAVAPRQPVVRHQLGHLIFFRRDEE